VCYQRQGDRVFETYWTTGRGVEAMAPTYGLLDMTVYGRQETWEDSPGGWPQRWGVNGEHVYRTTGRPTAQWSRWSQTLRRPRHRHALNGPRHCLRRGRRPRRRRRLKSGAYLLRATALTLERAHPRRREYLRIAAEMFEDLAGPAQEEDDRRTAFQALSQSAACWSLAGHQANAVVMGDRLRRAFAEFDVLTRLVRSARLGALTSTPAGSSSDLARLERLVRSRRALLDDVQSAALDGAAHAGRRPRRGRARRAHRPR
jgi:hypothetical protein